MGLAFLPILTWCFDRIDSGLFFIIEYSRRKGVLKLHGNPCKDRKWGEAIQPQRSFKLAIVNRGHIHKGAYYDNNWDYQENENCNHGVDKRNVLLIYIFYRFERTCGKADKDQDEHSQHLKHRQREHPCRYFSCWIVLQSGNHLGNLV